MASLTLQGGGYPAFPGAEVSLLPCLGCTHEKGCNSSLCYTCVEGPTQPPTCPSAFFGFYNDIDAATRQRTGQRSSVVVLGASFPTLVDVVTTPRALSTVALLASLSQ
eukprot:351335-Chlamydomonas_euryale.AAC.16